MTHLLPLQLQVIDAISSARQLDKPSVSYGAENLYMHGPLEKLTCHNLTKVSLGPHVHVETSDLFLCASWQLHLCSPYSH